MSIRSRGTAAACALGAFAVGLGCTIDARQVDLAGAGGTESALGADPAGMDLDAARAGTGGGAGSGGTAGGSAGTSGQPERPGTPELGGSAPRVASAQDSRISVSSDTIVTGTTVTLTLQVNDVAGQPLGKGGDAVTFNVTGGASEATIGPVTDRSDGTYTAPLTAVRSGRLLAVGATVNDEGVGGARPNVRVLPFSQQALDLDGASEFVSVSDLRQAQGTLSFWFNTTTATETDSYLVSKAVAAGSLDHFRIFLSDGLLRIRQGDQQLEIGNPVNDGLWHHLLVTFGTGTSVTLDGVVRFPPTGSGGGLDAPDVPLEFGRNSVIGDGYYAGQLDEVALYQGALSTDQALEIYGRGEPNDLKKLSSAGNLLHWWRLGELDQPPLATDSAGATAATLVDIGAENFVPVVR